MRISRFENNGAVVSVLFVLIATALASPFILFPHLPLVDLPVHIARHFIVASGPDAPVAECWTYAPSISTNSMIDILLYLVGGTGDPFLDARLVLILYVVNFMLAALVFHRVVIGRWSVWPLLCALIVYNGPLRWGFENYLSALPFALYGAALWLAAERWRLGWRLAVFMVFAALLYIGHAIAFALLAAFAAGRMTQQVFFDRSCRLGTGLILAVPFALPLLHLFASFGQGDNAFGNLTYFGDLRMRLRVLGQIVEGGPGSIDGPGPWIALAMLVVIILTPFALLALRLERPTLSRKALGGIAVLAVVLLLAPEKMGGVQFVASRISVFFALLVAASLDWSRVREGVKAAVLLSALAMLATRIVVFNLETAAHQRDIAELRGLMEQIPRGSRILQVNDARNKAKANQWHILALSVVERGNFIPSLFQGTHWLQVQPQYIDSAHPQFAVPMWRELLNPDAVELKHYVINQNGVNYLHDWERKFTHLLLITQPTGDVEALLPVTRIGAGERYALYEILDRPE